MCLTCVFIAGWSADIAERTQAEEVLSIWMQEVKHCLLMNSGSLIAIMVAHTKYPDVEELCLRQGRDIWSWQSPARGTVCGPHSRRGAPSHGAALEMPSCFPGSCRRNGEGGYYLTSRKQTDAKWRMQWKCMCMSVGKEMRNFYAPAGFQSPTALILLKKQPNPCSVQKVCTQAWM